MPIKHCDSREPFLKAKKESGNPVIGPGGVFAALLLLFICLRLVALLSGGAQAFQAEELYRGAIAREYLSGLKMPLFDYQADHYSGGSLVTGFAAAPFFLLFGPSLFSLKLAPLFFALLTLATVLVFLKRNFGFEAACFAGLFFIFAPPSFVKLSMVAMGFHSESIFFSALTLYFFYRYFFEERKPVFLFLFGLAGGLGFWFTHITVLIPMACFGAWIWLEPRSLLVKRRLGLIAAGGMAGLLPWFFYNFTHHFEGLGFIVKNLFHVSRGEGPSAFTFDLQRLALLTCKAIPMSFGLGWGVGLGYLLTGAGMVAFRFAKDPEKKKLLPLLLVPAAFILSYWLSAMEINAVTDPAYFTLFFDDCRYFVPLHFSLFLLFGIAAAGNAVRRFFAVLLLGAGIFGLNSLLFCEPWGAVLHIKGYSASQLGSVRGHVWPKQFSGFESYLKSLERYPEPDRFFVFWSSLYGLQFEKDLDAPGKIKRWMERTPPQLRPHFAEGVGYGIGAQQGLRFNPAGPVMGEISPEFHKFFYLGFATAALEYENAGEALRFADKLPEDQRDMFYFANGVLCPYERKPDGLAKMLGQYPEPERRAIFRGIGVRAAINWLIDGFTFPQAVRNLVFEIPQDYQKDFYFGVGWSVSQQFAEDSFYAAERLKEIPAGIKPLVLAGFEAHKKTYAIPQ